MSLQYRKRNDKLEINEMTRNEMTKTRKRKNEKKGNRKIIPREQTGEEQYLLHRIAIGYPMQMGPLQHFLTLRGELSLVLVGLALKSP